MEGELVHVVVDVEPCGKGRGILGIGAWDMYIRMGIVFQPEKKQLVWERLIGRGA